MYLYLSVKNRSQQKDHADFLILILRALAWPPFVATASRSSGLIFAALAKPPNLPRDTAAGFFSCQRCPHSSRSVQTQYRRPDAVPVSSTAPGRPHFGHVIALLIDAPILYDDELPKHHYRTTRARSVPKQQLSLRGETHLHTPCPYTVCNPKHPETAPPGHPHT